MAEYVPVNIGGFVVDAAIEEVHNYESEITSFPIEKGGIINDHIRLMPIGLNLDCIVSDSPIGEIIEGIRTSNGSFTLSGVDRRAVSTAAPVPWSARAHDHFKLLREKREPFSVVTSLQTYDNMVIERYTPTRKASDGNALRFQLSLRYLNVVTNERTTVKVASPNVAKKQPLGTRPTKVPPEDKPAATAATAPTAAQTEAERAAAERAARRSKNSILGNLVEDVPDWIDGVF